MSLVIECGRIGMEGEKIVAIYDKEIPKSVIELRSFSGLAKTSPLTKFVRPRSKKGSPVGEEHDKRIILAKFEAF